MAKQLVSGLKNCRGEVGKGTRVLFLQRASGLYSYSFQELIIPWLTPKMHDPE